MKKLFGWIWSSKQNEKVETFVIHNRPMWDVQMRDYNRTHGLPEDQVIGWCHEAIKKTIFQEGTQTAGAILWVGGDTRRKERKAQE